MTNVITATLAFTAIAMMQLWEQGLVDLDAPLNDYLRAYQLIPAKASFRPATVRHLLTHTAGIAEVLHLCDLLRPDWGDSVKIGDPVPPLAEFYRHGLPIDIEPGTSYSRLAGTQAVNEPSRTGAASPLRQLSGARRF